MATPSFNSSTKHAECKVTPDKVSVIYTNNQGQQVFWPAKDVVDMFCFIQQQLGYNATIKLDPIVKAESK